MDCQEWKKSRLKLGLNKAQLAREMGIQPSKATEYEAGTRPIPAYIEKLIKCLLKCAARY
jgi:predicted transcriptional regulator